MISIALSYDQSDMSEKAFEAFKAACLALKQICDESEDEAPVTAQELVGVYCGTDSCTYLGGDHNFSAAKARTNISAHRSMREEFHKTGKK